MSECSSHLCSFLLLLLDENGREANTSGCSMDVALERMDFERELASTSSGIMLKPGEIYGLEASFKLPSKKGSYRLEAQLIPAALTTQQRNELASKGFYVLAERCKAPGIRIEIR